ncbi:glyceraldehyde-3-phosphate dehydrogenase (NADP+) [Clostridium saccharoperbutylacetonicum]|uniref:NADP-dependent glyceraldehyde-3-phosphate dehydrogenase GapN n=1 Tax=Clostridium saccharoperbutylacetonicum N1-4(HMT) TaxID=931276 RepID=M1ML48_9CLOT|nr:NADP-dependent glyceraldehyde-3-phosphate dehydrogenase [Clostridium saccharoperbutylacetonicum]AGF56988.1 NADP-dependent glyceraldehyde-3-phosphate dehydrogenase GapN [Clostridium saccharoperbutylacetonicum N1-4(HMT)]NRT62253.1 glyceraldehyde-3-phosphate dehydrogenase (NADP+) [Clostridium saccharoperbutylacetonicum]NSB25589.1 glyceraldehyde-3-phosphate dehydrogenase (NADP+) [Clostridium saccharoperbutylacetonicum]NSB44956.1 glyceraldehyde-3-phosphate dehydrogenase (NADP+) [Clostridium sacch
MFNCIKSENNVFKNLINGQWLSSKEDNFIEINSPIDNSIVGKIPAMTKEEVDFVISTAKRAQKDWSKVPINERAEILYKAADILVKNIDELAEIMVREIGKDRKSSRSEITRTADFIRFTADTAKNLSGESIPGDTFPGYKRNKISVVSREPLGVVLAISPFNYPINLAASKIAPAIIVGNSVVLKPATQGSLCGLYLAKVFQEAGVPNGVLNTITGKGSEIGDYVVTHKDINFINFTGSTEVGTRISKITSMVPLLMELGGKDAAIVLEDADLELAATNIVAGGYSYSSQRCTAVKRILVIDKVADELVAKVKEKISKLKVGNPLVDDVDIVPLINKKAADYVSELIEDAKNKGADLVAGGNRDGNIIFPTLFDNVTTDMRIAWEEPFGPVLPIIRVKNKDEAIEIANKSEYGLQSAVFTKNIDDAFYIADRLEVGTVQVNGKTERGPDHFPFLGVKASGIGTQGIRYSIESMSRPKATVINLLK